LFFRAAPTRGASALAEFLARLEAEHGDPVAAFDHLTLAIRNHHDSGNTTSMRCPLAVLASLLNRLGRHEPAATIAGCVFGPLITAWIPDFGIVIAHLRESSATGPTSRLPQKARRMTTAVMVTYAYDQIDEARPVRVPTASSKIENGFHGPAQQTADLRERLATEDYPPHRAVHIHRFTDTCHYPR
jgi:hypothetical protein